MCRKRFTELFRIGRDCEVAPFLLERIPEEYDICLERVPVQNQVGLIALGSFNL